jgi:tetratricopeptide (TPR) repeat protein
MMDGSPPPELIRIELACGHYVQEQIYTDENGVFVFQLGKNQSESGFVDVSASPSDSGLETPTTPFKTVNLGSCEIRLVENQGYSGQKIRLGSRSAFDSPDVGDIFVEKEGSQRGTVISVVSLAAPKKAVDALEKARKELEDSKPDLKKAEKELKKAIKEYENYATAWQLLGEVKLSTGKLEEAREAFESAIKADQRFVTPYLSLARLDMYADDWQKAREHSQKVIDLEVQSPRAFYYAGLSNFYLGNQPDALKSYESLKTTGHTDEYPIAYFHLGIIYAQQGNPPASAAEFEKYLQIMPEEKMPSGQKEQIEGQLETWKRLGLYKPSEEKPD